VEEGLVEDLFLFKRGKGTSGVIGMLGVISERAFDIDELCDCFINWQKACDSVNWTKLMQILNGTGMDWRDGRLISKLYMERSVKMNWAKGGQMCEDLKSSSTRMLFVADSIQLERRIP